MTTNHSTDFGEIHALLGRNTEYEGKLSFNGRVRIDGHFRGEIFSDGILIVGREAKLEGQIEVGTLIVRGGQVSGQIKAQQLVEIHSTAEVRGDIDAPQVFIERGATFDGQCTMPGSRTEAFSAEHSGTVAKGPDAITSPEPATQTGS